ncbi:MAG: AAA-like domain-containing protein [Rhizonema sp. PD38]|nr:AAA-like domain-containing protein [Rhizonema sp. PD38]
MQQFKSKRRRGTVLTPKGLKRLQTAILAVEMTQNNGDRFTLNDLGSRINVSTKTLSRLWSLNTRVDQKTLRLCFSAFNLKLHSEDYVILSEPNKIDSQARLRGSLASGFRSSDRRTEAQRASAPSPSEDTLVRESGALCVDSFVNCEPDKLEHLWPYPDGPIPLGSSLYVLRPPIEELAFHELHQLGCVIRISAPKQMGKSSLVLRLLAFAQSQGYHTVNLNCYQFDSNCLTNLNQLLRSLCWRVARELGIDPNLNNYWDEEFGCKFNCSFYFQYYLLKQIQSSVVLVLNEVDRLFKKPDIAEEFFALLHSWCEEARQNAHWQKFKLVVVYSTQELVTQDINCSSFNIGLPIRLPEFTQQQVEELAYRHGFFWSAGKESAQLMSLVGGHPALIQIALYYLSCQEFSLDKLIQSAYANGGIYRDHLWGLWVKLLENPSLASTYAKVLATEQGISLNPIEAVQLESLGLIRIEGVSALVRCELYRAYFQKQLSFGGLVTKNFPKF